MEDDRKKITMKRKIDTPDTAELDAARRDDLAERRSAQDHEIAIGDLGIDRKTAKIEQGTRRADVRDRAALMALVRRAKVSGTRARLRFDLYQSAEVQTLRLDKIRKVSLASLLPFLAGFAAWSTVGVHTGTMTLFHAAPGSGVDRGAWLVEPGLIAIVAFVIILGAVLKSMGGKIGGRATAIEITALVSSILLNLAGAWPKGGASWETVPAIVGHSVGPLGCAAIAVLISIADNGISETEKIVAKNAKPLDKMFLEELGGTETASHDRVSFRRLTPSHSVSSQPEIETRLTETASETVPDEMPISVPSEMKSETRPTEMAVSVPSETKSETVPVPRETSKKDDRLLLVVNTWEANPGITYPEVARMTGVPRATVGRYLQGRTRTS